MEIKTALQNRKETLAAHPLLDNRLLTGKLYQHIKAHPGVCVPELRASFRRPYYTLKEAVGKLKREGLVKDISKTTHKGRVVSRLQAISENESAFPRDAIELSIVIYVNDYGEYYAETYLEGELPSARNNNPRPIHNLNLKTRVPRPFESYKTRQIFDASIVPKKADYKEPLTVEGEIIDSPARNALVPVNETRRIRPQDRRRRKKRS
jgi:hypothetical protein